MRKITNLISGMQFVVPYDHPNQPEWGRPAVVRQIDERFNMHMLDERDLARIELISPTCISFKSEFTEEPYVEPLTRSQYEQRIDDVLMRVVKSWDYFSIERLLGYAISKNPQYAADARAFSDWRDDVVTKSYEVFAKVVAGDIQQPSLDEFEAMLPKAPDQPKV